MNAESAASRRAAAKLEAPPVAPDSAIALRAFPLEAEKTAKLVGHLVAKGDAEAISELAVVMLTLGGHKPTNAPKVVADGDTDRAQLAAERMAEAFATIEEYSDLIPERARALLSQGLDEILNESCPRGHWTAEPRLLRQCLPTIFHQIFDTAEAEEDEDDETAAVATA